MNDSPNRTNANEDRWFFGALAIATVLVGVLFAPYSTPLLFAVVIAITTWPLLTVALKHTNNNRLAAGLGTVSILALALFGPLVLILGYASHEAIDVIGRMTTQLQSGEVSAYLVWLSSSLNHWAHEFPWLEPYIPSQDVLLDTLQTPLQTLGLSLLNMGTSLIPAILGGSAQLLVQSAIFLFALVTFYADGPRIIQALHDLVPLNDDIERHLGDVFSEFSKNIVIGSLITAIIQGAIASIGYAIGGAPRVVLLGLLTALFSFIPFFGAAGVGIVVGLGVCATQSVTWGVFIIVWSIVCTGTVDNAIKPMLLRGKEEIHPLLIFLGVFGGMHWLGVTGAVIGPMVVALFLAMFTLYRENHITPKSTNNTEDESLGEV